MTGKSPLPLSQSEADACKAFLADCLIHAKQASASYSGLDPDTQPEFVLANRLYWQNVESAIKWLTSMLPNYVRKV